MQIQQKKIHKRIKAQQNIFNLDLFLFMEFDGIKLKEPGHIGDTVTSTFDRQYLNNI